MIHLCQAPIQISVLSLGQLDHVKSDKFHSRSEAMRLFEADCPRQLVTEMGLAERKRREDKKAEQVSTVLT